MKGLFEQEHEAFIRSHLERRKGERRGRLERGHRHGETTFLRNLWWPLLGSFEHLHPEFEVVDWRGRSYFADFAWLPGFVKLLIEIKGFASHITDMDRQKFCNEMNRETFLYGMGFDVISFAYDDVEQRPEMCMHLLRMAINRHRPEQAPIDPILLAEKEIIRLMIYLAQPVRPKDIADHLQINGRTATRKLGQLCEKGWVKPSPRGSGERNVRFELARGVMKYFD